MRCRLLAGPGRARSGMRRAPNPGLQLIASSQGRSDTVETDPHGYARSCSSWSVAAIMQRRARSATVRHADHTDRQSRWIRGRQDDAASDRATVVAGGGDSSEEQQITASGVNMAVCRPDRHAHGHPRGHGRNGETVMILAIPTPPVPASRGRARARKSPPKVAVPAVAETAASRDSASCWPRMDRKTAV